MMFNAMLNYISVEGDCPDEWTSIAGGCYKFLPEKYNWEDAKEACHMLHGWLVEIESEEQNDAIHDEAKKQDGWKTAWIGLTDTAEEGEWVWSSGKATDFTNWAPDQPSNTKQQRNKMQGEDCAMMNIDHGADTASKPWTTPKKWNDASCPVAYNVICQYEKGGFTRTAVCEKK